MQSKRKLVKLRILFQILNHALFKRTDRVMIISFQNDSMFAGR